MSPDGSTKPSPEERLLRLIRTKAPQPSAATPGGGSAAAVLRARHPTVSLTMLAAAILLIALVGELGYLVVEALQPLRIVEVPMVDPSQVGGDGAGTGALTPEVPSLADSAARPLFASAATTGAVSRPPPAAPRSGPSDTVKKLSARLTLSGLMDGEPPQAIITDAETNKTYFVTPGQVVVDGAVLAEVLDNRVILELDGEKIELSL